MLAFLRFISIGLLCLHNYVFAATAIIFGNMTQSYYVKSNESTGKDAKTRALKMCYEENNAKCKVILSSDYGGYGGLVNSTSSGKWFFAHGYTNASDVKNDLLQTCSKKYGNCAIDIEWHDIGKVVYQEEATCRNPSTGFAMVCGERVDTGGYVYGQQPYYWSHGYTPPK